MPAIWPNLQAESAESQDRTGDTAIFSRVLYLLSYLGLTLHAFLRSLRILLTRAFLVKRYFQ